MFKFYLYIAVLLVTIILAVVFLSVSGDENPGLRTAGIILLIVALLWIGLGVILSLYK